MRHWSFLVLMAWLLGWARADESVATTQVRVTLKPGPLSVRLDGTPLVFRQGTAGQTQTLVGESAPALTIVDARGLPDRGWHVTLQAGPLTSVSGQLPASALFYEPGNGRLEQLAGNRLPRETMQSGNLESGITLLSAEDSRGTYRYQPPASNFRLRVPASAPAGDYTGLLTVTVFSGP